MKHKLNIDELTLLVNIVSHKTQQFEIVSNSNYQIRNLPQPIGLLRYKLKINQKVLINYNTLPEDELSKNDIIIDFGYSENQINEEFQSRSLYLLYNLDEKDFWILPNLQVPLYQVFPASASKTTYDKETLSKFSEKSHYNQLVLINFRILYKNELSFYHFFDKTEAANFAIYLKYNEIASYTFLNILHKDTTYLLKLSAGSIDERWIENELVNTQIMSEYKFEAFIMPGLYESGYPNLVIYNYPALPKKPFSSDWQEVHSEFLTELYSTTWRTEKTGNLNFRWRLLKTISQLKASKAIFFSASIISYLVELSAALDEYKIIPVARSHGNFIPGTVENTNNKLIIHNWQYSHSAIPLLYDLFHYTLYHTIVNEHKSYIVAMKYLKKVLKQKSIKQIVKLYNIDVDFHLLLYLLDIISKEMKKFGDNLPLTHSEKRQLKNWNQALGEMSLHFAEQIHANLFITEISGFELHSGLELLLEPQGVRLRSEVSKMEFAADKLKTGNSFARFIKRHPLVKRVKLKNKATRLLIDTFMQDNSQVQISIYLKSRYKTLEKLKHQLFLRTEYQNATKDLLILS